MRISGNILNIGEIPGSHPFQRFIQSVMSILGIYEVSIMVQQEGQVNFPDVPLIGGMFYTRKGAYEAIFLDPPNPGDEEQPRWRRLYNGTQYEPGATIPTTL